MGSTDNVGARLLTTEAGHSQPVATDGFRATQLRGIVRTFPQLQRASRMYPVMNNTKWEELRAAMFELEKPSPKWRIRILGSGFESGWDSEWFYHFRDSYDDLEWVEISPATAEQAPVLLAALREIHLPGTQTDVGFKVFGHLPEGMPCEYL